MSAEQSSPQAIEFKQESAAPSTRPAWKRQLAEAYKSPQALGHALSLPTAWIRQHAPARELFPMLVPRHFASLMKAKDTRDPLLRQVWPHEQEYEYVQGFTQDPLGEANATQQSGLLHKYKSRVLIILRGGCAVNCRYCFRRHFPYAEHKFGTAEQAQLMGYLAAHQDVNEVILSGGDPLMADDDKIIQLMKQIETLPHITRLRIHSRLPVVIPDRLTSTLADALGSSRFKSILVLHANHGNELSIELKERLKYWRKAGIHLLNQSVLLKGINDDAATLTQLSEKLFELDILPYYLHQLDKVTGAAHFAVSDTEATLLIEHLQQELPGFLVPKLVREIAGETSKTPLYPAAT